VARRRRGLEAVDQSQRQHCVAKGVARRGARTLIFILLTPTSGQTIYLALPSYTDEGLTNLPLNK